MHLKNAILKQTGVMLRISLVTSFVEMTNLQEFAEEQLEQPKFCSHESQTVLIFSEQEEERENKRDKDKNCNKCNIF